MKRNKSQVSMEFMITIGIMMIVFLAIVTITNAKLKEMTYYEELRELKNPCNYVASLITNVHMMGHGAKVVDKVDYNFTIFGEDRLILAWKTRAGKNQSYYCSYPIVNVTNGYNTTFMIERHTNLTVENINGQIEIKNPSLEEGLVLWLRSDEDVYDGVIDDDSRYNNDAEIVLTAGSAGCSEFSNKGFACHFDGNNDILRVSYSPELGIVEDGNPGTILLWVNLSAAANRAFISQQNGIGVGRNWIYFYSLTNAISTRLGGAIQTFVSNFPQDNQWHHVGFTYNGSHTVGYFDGEPNVTDALTRDENADGDLIIGASKSLGGDLLGNIGDLRIYNRNLSATEVKRIYESYLSYLDLYQDQIPR